MRIRQVKPAFWSDAILAELPDATRLFYVGLWMVADDAGWLRWNAVEVSRDLYGYETRRRRERRVTEMFTALVAASRVVLHPCGHAEVPKLVGHQHLSAPAKQVRSAFNEHLRECVSRGPADTRDDPRMPADARNGNGKERERERVSEGSGQVRVIAHAHDDEGTEFTTAMERHGLRPLPRSA